MDAKSKTERTRRQVKQEDPAVSRESELQDLLMKANAGDRQAVAKLRACLEASPDVYQRAGDLAAHAENAWITLVGGGGWLATEAIKRNLSTLKSELAGERPTRLESLLVDQVALCWLATQHASMDAAQPSNGAVQAALQLKRSESALRRFMLATKTLTTLRALTPHGMMPLDRLKIHQPYVERA